MGEWLLVFLYNFPVSNTFPSAAAIIVFLSGRCEVSGEIASAAAAIFSFSHNFIFPTSSAIIV